jgi:DNA polymerase III sliding clamp (beta) subunit (PCNA family)
MTHQVSVKVLKGAILHAGQTLSRSVHGCISIKFDGRTCRVESTDGTTCYRSTVAHESEPFEVIVPLAAVKLAVKVRTPTLELTADRLGSQHYEPMESRFPDLTRVIPTDPSGKTGLFDYVLVARCQASLSATIGVRRAHFELQHNGTGAALMRSTTVDALCVVMPIRLGKNGFCA